MTYEYNPVDSWEGLNSALRDIEVATEEGEVINPTLGENWTNYSDVYEGAGFWKDGNNIVYIQGMIKDGNIPGIPFTLPVGYRPRKRLIFTSTSFGPILSRIDVLANGSVSIQNGDTNWVSLSGIVFKAYQ